MGQLVPLHRGRCDTRAVKGFSRQAYDNGVVIVTCPGCERQHVVADRYGWFGDPGSVEDFLADQADQKVVVGSAKLGVPAGVVGGEVDEDGTLEIDQEQLSAWLAKQAAGAAGAETETETETGEGGGGEGK
jgi:protein import protein ZIM17